MVKEKIILDGHKLAWHRDRVEAWLNGGRIAPITIDWALTRRCNYRCVYCYGQLQENEGPLGSASKTIPKDKIFRFLDDCAEIGVKAISLVSDGESTCSPHFYDAILYGKQNGLDMATGTNGRLLKKERLEEILPALSYLRFNFSAGEPRRYAEIHGCREEDFYEVCDRIKQCAEIKNEKGLDVTIGMQMVLLPELRDQIVPLSRLGKELGADYLVIKHCSDDEKGSLGVDYEKYAKDELIEKLKEAETCSDGSYLVKVKWSKIMSGGKRRYSRCYGPPFILQLSGSGLVAPCGPFFGDDYKKYHIGNIVSNPLKEIWQGNRYWEVMDHISSEEFDARTDCGTLCLQHKVNECLNELKKGTICLDDLKAEGEPPMHVNFI